MPWRQHFVSVFRGMFSGFILNYGAVDGFLSQDKTGQGTTLVDDLMKCPPNRIRQQQQQEKRRHFLFEKESD